MPATLQLHLTRQPILDKRNQLFGYELLFQPERGSGGSSRGEVYEAVVASLQSMNLPLITDGKAAMVTLGRETVLSGCLDELDPRGLVIALDEHVTCDNDLIAACENLRARGFKLALDNLYWDGSQDALLNLADYAKIETLALTPEELADQVQVIKGFAITLVAEQVESEQAYEDCARMGFDLFQGFSYFQSRSKDGSAAPRENTMAVMRILNLLTDPNVRDRQVEESFRSDPRLTFQLLKMVNSAAIGGRGVESIGHALRLLGRGAIHRWLALILATQGGRGEAVRNEVIKSSLLRARLCELLGQTSGSSLCLPSSESLFLVGLFSHMDSLTGRPMDAVLKGMKISDEVKGALLDRSGATGDLLSAVEAYEEADWDKAEEGILAVGLETDGLSERFLEALTWASDHLANDKD